jgi:cytochrome-b5 reductase
MEIVCCVVAALLTRYQGPEDKKPTIRPYTPINDEDARGYLDLLVKR